MNYYRTLTVIVFFLLFQLSTSGQFVLPDYQAQTVHNKQLLVRWEPRDVNEWHKALANGYEIKVYEGKSVNSLLLSRTEHLKPLPLTEWEQAINQQQDTLLRSFYEGARNFLFMEEEIKEEIKKSLAKEEGKSKQQSVDEFQLGYLLYAITYDYDLIHKAGLGYSIPVTSGSFYRIEVSTRGYDNFTFNYGPDIKTDQKIPDLKARFGNKKVNLEWLTQACKKQYFGYYLAVSQNGKQYTPINDVPYVDVRDTIQGVSKFQSIQEEVTLERNYKNYWFRLKGMNYFGIQSRLSSVEKGYGYEIIEAMPIIHHADQTADNHADIRWKLDSKFNRLIDHFEIYRSNELEGEYISVLDSIPVNHRAVSIPMEHNRNYFSVAIVPKDGKVIRSFAVFLMGQDTVPPIVPQNFTGTIDSMGIVTLNWDQNTEEDLWGYKVFRTEYLSDELGSLHSSPIQDTFFADTINLNSITEKIHYSIIALDKRNNRSRFAPIISLLRPDTIPPDPPLIRAVDFMEDSIKVTWAASSSKDAVLHQLFRKEINEPGWELIAEQSSVNALNYYIDTLFQLDKSYAYTVIAKDEKNLQSEPSRALKVFTESRRAQEAFKGFDVQFDEEKKTSTIKWDYNNVANIEEVIVYRGPSKEKISMYQILHSNTNELSQKVDESDQWFFLFKPILNNGKRAKVSEIILVETPRN